MRTPRMEERRLKVQKSELRVLSVRAQPWALNTCFLEHLLESNACGSL